MSGSRPDRGEDLVLALEAVRAAGRPIMAGFRTDAEVRHKGPDQPVTDADLEADAVLRERLTGPRPEYGWLSEESVDDPARLERDRTWVVDPIDGTRSYVAGYREFAVSVALVEGHRPVLGVIYNPARSHVVWATAAAGAASLEAWDGRVDGAALDGARRLSLVEADDAAPGGVLLASRSERARGEFEPFRQAWTIREVGSTAWKLAAVALGRGAYISRGPKSEWDVAAGILIVAEAGGVATDLEAQAVAFNRATPYVHGVVAGRRDAHARLLERASTLESPRLGRQAWQGNADDTR